MCDDVVKTLSQALSDIYKYSSNEEFRREFRNKMQLSDSESSQHHIQKLIENKIKFIRGEVTGNQENVDVPEKLVNDNEDFDALVAILEEE